MPDHVLQGVAAHDAPHVNPMCYGPGYGRRYYTREERKQWLEEYAGELENELKAVRERLKEVESSSTA